jgi:hypothetical protein
MPRPAVVRTELSCLLCGEIAGVIENRRIVRPRSPGSLRYDGRRLTCGRCGSALIPGDDDPTPQARAPEL